MTPSEQVRAYFASLPPAARLKAVEELERLAEKQIRDVLALKAAALITQAASRHTTTI